MTAYKSSAPDYAILQSRTPKTPVPSLTAVNGGVAIVNCVQSHSQTDWEQDHKQYNKRMQHILYIVNTHRRLLLRAQGQKLVQGT